MSDVENTEVTTFQMGSLTKEGESFQGAVYSYPVRGVDKLIEDETIKYATSGRESLLRALKIPVKFFEKQEHKVKQDLLVKQKVDFADDSKIYFLERRGEIVWASLRRPNIGFKDPSTLFGITPDNSWVFRSEDLNKGMQRFVYQPTELVKDEFCVTLFIDIPIFYHSQMNFEVGLYRVVCTNGMLDKKFSNNFQLNFSKFDHTFVTPVIGAILEELKENPNKFLEFLTFLKETEIGTTTARNLLTSWKKDKLLPKSVFKKVDLWISYMEMGKELDTTDDIIPTSLNSYMDLLNVVTRYAQSEESVSVVKKIEANMFFSFFTIYKNLKNRGVQGYHLKELIKNTNLLNA